MYQPVMATSVVYMQKLLGRKAARQGGERSAQPPTLHPTPAASYRTLTVPGQTGTTTAHKGKVPKYQPPSLRTKDIQGRQPKSLFKRHSNIIKQEAATETGLGIVTQRRKFESALIL